MPIPQSSRYQFIECVADHPPFQSWRTVNRATGQECFVKYTLASSAAEPAISMQIAAFKLQADIKSAGVLRARAYYLENANLLVEYPLLDSSVWSRLSLELFWQQPEYALTEICLRIDYLHLLGLVHGDIKLDNFMVSSAPVSSLKLIDLDFLSRQGSRPQARLFGTPDHIAPEIRANYTIAAQSDNYSLGVSLRAALAWRQDHGAAQSSAGELEDKLRSLAEDLTHPEHLQRPYGLLEALRQHQLLDSAAYLTSARRLLASYLVSRIRWPHFAASAESSGYELRSKLGIFGIPSELSAAVWNAAQRRPRATFARVKEFITHSHIERFEKFFCIAPEDQPSAELLQACYAIVDNHALELPTHSTPAHIMARGHQLSACQQSLAAYLLMKQNLSILETAEHPTESVDYLCALGKLAMQQFRLSEVHSYLERALTIQQQTGAVTAEVVHEAAMAAMRTIQLDRAAAYLEIAEQLSNLSLEQRLKFERIRAWIFHLRGNYGDAAQLITQVTRQADEAQLHAVGVAGRYLQGVLAWRQSDNRQALIHLTEAYRLARAHDLLADAVLVMSMLAMMYGEAGRYRKSVRMAKLAVQIAPPEQTPTLQFLHEILISSCVRMASFAKARYWLQEYIGNRAPGGGRQLIAGYSMYTGLVESQEGRLREGAAALGPVGASAATTADRLIHGKVCQNLATIELWRGRANACREYVATARQDFTAIQNSTALAEMDLLEELAAHIDPLTGDREKLLALATKLQHYSSCYYANLALFFAFLCQSDESVPDMSPQTRQIIRYKDSQSVPLFAALRTLSALYAQPGRELRQEIPAWKAAFTALLQGKQIHLALQAAIRISRLYAQANHPRHARSYLLHAKSLAQSLENEASEAFLDQLLAVTITTPSNHTRLVESYLSISEMLRDIGQYQQAVRRVLEFAIEQTGAERGILFLKKGDRDEFQIAASVNCDERSLKELSDFSSHLPWLSSQEQTPLLIDNAVQDQRTSKYHSVIEHNILSVACVPLRDNQTLRGVLYLDHHTIPALFEPDDIRYLMSLANFLTLILTTASNWRSITLTNAELRDELSRQGTPSTMVTQDPAMLRMMEKLPQIARTSTSVLILGESGTGKEILADMIHRLSLRAAEPLIKLNCATLSPTLLESELFGIARNVATGVAERDGKFAAADGGTLFLDEIGDMPLEIQAKVLRAIEYQQFEKVGSNRTIHTDIRFIYATHRDLAQAVDDGTFRRDLYYRINTIALFIPPLRQRRPDIPLLVEHFLTLLSHGARAPRFAPAAIDALVRYHWPGNIRQLRNVVDHCIILHPGALIEPDMLPYQIVAEPERSEDAAHAAKTAEKERIKAALQRTRGNQSQAAKLLGMSLGTLRRRITEYGLEDFT